MNEEIKQIQSIKYITDQQGNQTAVIIPIELWRKILPQEEESIALMTEKVEDYCLNKAMNEAQNTALLSREQAIAFLEEEEE